MDQAKVVKNTAKKLTENSDTYKSMVGFDGFVDEIIHLVDKRKDVDNFTRLANMPEFAERINKAAGKSGNIELIIDQVKLGGNGPIMANALLAHGQNLFYMGALGKERIHKVFTEFSKSCQKVYSFADPGLTHALEFFDGKMMLGKLQTVNEVTWENLLKNVGKQNMLDLLNELNLVAMVNWTMLPYMNSIYKGMTSLLEKCDERKTVFIDLCDPRKRTNQDVLDALEILGEMQGKADVILGLNEEESEQIAQILEISDGSDLQQRAHLVREKTGLHMIVIHPIDRAVVANGKGNFEVKGPYTTTPKLTTGAGDNFNAGFCAGYLSGLDSAEALVTGVCTSGYYVRNCHSPNKQELTSFMQEWADRDCADI